METTEPQAEGPMTDEQAVDALLAPIEPEAEAETDGETLETETEAVEAEVEDDASEVEDENPDEVEASDDDEADETDEDETPDDDDAEGDRLFTVKVDGEEKQITEQELKNDYAGRASLQKRHQELKTQEEQFQQFAQAMQQERQQLLQFAQQAQENGFKQPPKKPDPAMMQTDPIGYMEAKAAYDQEVETYQQEQQQLQFQQQRAQQIAQAQQAQYEAKQREIAQQLIPELRDEKKAPELQSKMVQALRAAYFSDEEIKGVKDARFLPLIHKAALWDELQAGKQAARKPAQEAKPVTRPKGKMRDGGKQMQAKKQLQKAMKTQSDDDWVNVLLQS